MELLIHSMAELREVILPALDIAGARDVAEVGSEYGGMTALLAERAKRTGGSLTAIDPEPQEEFLSWVAATPEVTHLALPSLEAIPTVEADAWLVDGDHNYHTVYNETLGILHSRRARDGYPLIFFHDVGWPCGRRDFYYAPSRIPEAERHGSLPGAGVTLEKDELLPGRGFRGEGDYAFARRSGGSRNGVLTAVEDALREKGPSLTLGIVPAIFGLGVVYDSTAPWGCEMANHLAPYVDNPLIARLEENRLRNYLQVIEWQDRMVASELDGH